MGLLDKVFNKKKSEDTIDSEMEQEVLNKEHCLILLIEKQLPGIREYLCENGLDVAELYTNIEDAKIGLLMQSGACRIVIVESGLGRFTTTTMRAELTDLIGMCDGVEKKLTIFYTNSIIKTEDKGKKSTQIDWIPYFNTSGIVEKIKSYKETYEIRENTTEEYESTGLEFKGERVDTEEQKIVFNLKTESNANREKVAAQLDTSEGTDENGESTLLKNYKPVY